MDIATSKKAIDVVLLPSDEMTDLVIKANRNLVENFGSEIVLNKQNCLPHISLVMGCIKQDDIASVGEILARAAQRIESNKFEAVGVQISENIRGEIVSSLRLDNTAELQRLHEELTEELSGFLSYDVTAEMVFDFPQVSETTLSWIRNYRTQSSYSNFFPHITLGYGKLQGLKFPIEFEISKLAMCHLGNHCTCREVLGSVELAKT
ncbi:MAG: 2'-5' RNA ligase family protein [Planctomycetota bacterium]|jgi:2'-5' RNA ligase